MTQMSRRGFLMQSTLAVGTASAMSRTSAAAELAEPTPAKLPQWHGFNLLEKFMVHQNARYVETDFAWMAELGFNFARFPLDYRCWIDANDWTKFNEAVLKEIDEGVAFGEKHGIHIALNFHRAPGYTVAQPAEAKNLWKDEEAQKICALHWGTFAKRYKGIPNSRLSFNLFNEPTYVAPDDHRRVVERMLEAIRAHDDKRLVICDGRLWGRTPPEELLGLGVAGATRGYEPHKLTHYQASWVGGSDKWPVPEYPLNDGSAVWNKELLRTRCIDPWKQLEAKGMGVVVGEFGAYNKSAHTVVLSWMRDFLALWKEAGWGSAMWNFRGSFGILDSERADVTYEDWHGHKLDRAMLDLLKSAM